MTEWVGADLGIVSDFAEAGSITKRVRIERITGFVMAAGPCAHAMERAA